MRPGESGNRNEQDVPRDIFLVNKSRGTFSA